MTKPRITQTTSYDNPGTLVFWLQRSRRHFNEITPTGAPNRDGVGSHWHFSTIYGRFDPSPFSPQDGSPRTWTFRPVRGRFAPYVDVSPPGCFAPILSVLDVSHSRCGRTDGRFDVKPLALASEAKPLAVDSMVKSLVLASVFK